MGGNQRKYTRSAQHCVGSKRLKKVDSCPPSAHRGVYVCVLPEKGQRLCPRSLSGHSTPLGLREAC